jgi:hypothetical protein
MGLVSYEKLNGKDGWADRKIYWLNMKLITFDLGVCLVESVAQE